ncbi:MAG: universal stress protein [Haloferacaceae archaeon]
MRLLLGIGGRDDSLRALDAAVERAAEAGDRLTVAVVDDPESDREAGELVDRAAARLDEADLDAELRRVEGHPGSELVEMAERGDFDRIVIGGGESSPMGKIRLGEVAEYVLLNSRITVTLVR